MIELQMSLDCQLPWTMLIVRIMNIKLNCFKVLLEFVFKNFTDGIFIIMDFGVSIICTWTKFCSLHFAASCVVLLFTLKRERM